MSLLVGWRKARSSRGLSRPLPLLKFVDENCKAEKYSLVLNQFVNLLEISVLVESLNIDNS